MKPELKVRTQIINYLKVRRWHMEITVGGIYQSGIPDILAFHQKYGTRLIEVKLPNMKGSKFTPAQLKKFPRLYDHGAPIYILTAGTDEEYAKLFQPSNLYEYMQKPETLLERIQKELRSNL